MPNDFAGRHVEDDPHLAIELEILKHISEIVAQVKENVGPKSGMNPKTVADADR